MGENDKKPSQPGGGYHKKGGSSNKKKSYVAKPTARPIKFLGGKGKLDEHHFECTGYR